MKNSGLIFITALFLMLSFVSCERLLNPEQELYLTEDKVFTDWYEYRSVEMGLYGLQQQLVEQLVILGELRGDLLTITENADADMVEIYNFNVSPDNKYASPTKFFRLITACNNFIRVLEEDHPEVMDMSKPTTNYDRLYGEALCMRAWAYFNAVRIYGQVPFIPASIVGMEETDAYINSPNDYFFDTLHVTFGLNGYDTLHTVSDTTLQKQFFDTDMVIDYFTEELESKVKAVGVNHYLENNDESWEITIWGDFSMKALLGHMHLTRGNLADAVQYFEDIVKNTTESRRYHLDRTFAYSNWRQIFQDIDNREHIYTIWFNKENFQQNRLQEFFEPWGPHKYMLKPTKIAIDNWETEWRAQILDEDRNNPSKSRLREPGIPSDFYRGMYHSYHYANNDIMLTEEEYFEMLFLRMRGDDKNSRAIMENMDTVVFKYSITKDRYDQDANFIVYRAGSIHLYLAEIYTYYTFWQNDLLRQSTITATAYLNDGSVYDTDANRPQVGVRGRVGLSRGYDAKNIRSIRYIHDPYTNKIIDYIDLEGRFARSQELFEEDVILERALELAYEGERFYDLMRVAKRRNDPSYLAKKVAAKYPSHMKDEIENILMDPNNWYINYFNTNGSSE